MERPNMLARMEKMKIATKQPLVELTGHNRVLIENHLGVLAYSLQEIQVKVSYGTLCVAGCDLQILQLSREQLVISGKIDTIKLFRR